MTSCIESLPQVSLSNSDSFKFAELISAHTLDNTGSEVPMTGEHWAKSFRALLTRFPEKFLPPPSEAVFNLEMAHTPADGNRLKMYGEWFHRHRRNLRAAQLLEKARSAGASPDPLLLARCNWLAGNYDKAIAAFEQVIAANKDLRQDAYLKQCLNAVRHEATEKKSS